MRKADILLHIVDITHPHFEEHITVVNETLKEIGAADKNVILVFNKIDAFTFTEKEEFDLTPVERQNISLEELKSSWMANNATGKTIFISAEYKQNIDEFKEMLFEEVKKIHSIRYPYQTYNY